MRRIKLIAVLIALTTISLSAQTGRTDDREKDSFAKGRELYNQKNYAVSSKFFTEFLDSEKDNLTMEQRQEAEYYIVCCAFETKNKKTLNLLETYLEKYPYTPMSHKINYLIGRCYYEKKAYEKSNKYYNKVDSNKLSKKECDDFLFSKAYNYVILKEYKKASAIFSTITGYTKPYKYDAEYYYAYCEFCLKNYVPAFEAFENIEEQSSYFEAAQFHMLQIFDQLGRKKDAVRFGKELITRYPKSKYSNEAYRVLGENSYYQGNWEDAVSYFKKYSAQQEKLQRDAIYMLGISYYKTEEYKSAISSLGRVTNENDTLSQNAYLFIGHSYLKTEEADKARMSFQSASLQNFDKRLQEEALYNYALATYESNAPFGETIKSFERFVNEYPNSKYLNDIYEHMADVYISDKNYKDAVESISNIKNPTPKLIQAKEHALFQLGLDAFRIKQYKNAIELFSKSLETFSAQSFSAQAYAWRGEAQFRNGNITAAREDLNLFLKQKQAKTADQLQKAYYTLGYTYFTEKKYNLSTPYFNKFLEVDGASRSKLYGDVLNRLADNQFTNRNFTEARKLYDKVPISSSVADYAMFQNAFILGLQKQYDAKIKSLNTLISKLENSDYRDDAMYEIGRTYFLQEKYPEAIKAYNTLQKSYPQSRLTRQSSLEIGMIYANMDETDKAIQAYKDMIARYPSSEETRVALDNLQNIYVNSNRVDEYISYRESVAGITISTMAKSQEDSISFIAAEQAYAKGNYESAIPSLNNYIIKYCETPTLNCISARYYLAEAYYQTNDREKALSYFQGLASLDGNTYMEPSLLRASEITYDNKNYGIAKEFFDQLHIAASSNENRMIARVGILRCSYYTNQTQSTINIATEIIDNNLSDENIIREARYCRYKAYYTLEQYSSAVDDLIKLGKNISYESGAEAKYVYAQYQFDNNKYSDAEATIMEFINIGTSHQYWLARCFVLLSDIYMAQDDLFMAKQYLLSLQENYTKNDDIQLMINERIGTIQQLESENILQEN